MLQKKKVFASIWQGPFSFDVFLSPTSQAEITIKSRFKKANFLFFN